MGLDHDFNIQTSPSVELDMSGGTTGSLFGGEGNFGGEGFFGDLVTDLLPAHRRRAVRGTVFSAYFSHSTLDQSWSMHRVDHMLRETRRPATVTA